MIGKRVGVIVAPAILIALLAVSCATTGTALSRANHRPLAKLLSESETIYIFRSDYSMRIEGSGLLIPIPRKESSDYIFAALKKAYPEKKIVMAKDYFSATDGAVFYIREVGQAFGSSDAVAGWTLTTGMISLSLEIIDRKEDLHLRNDARTYSANPVDAESYIYSSIPIEFREARIGNPSAGQPDDRSAEAQAPLWFSVLDADFLRRFDDVLSAVIRMRAE